MALNDPLTDLCPRIGFTPRFANPAAEISGSHGGVFAFPGGVLMPTFAQPKPLTERITWTLMQLRRARYDGAPDSIYIAQRRLDDLTDRLPVRPLSETDPRLDAHLRVTMK